MPGIMMQPSMELRWFLKGALREDLKSWFEKNVLTQYVASEFEPNIEERNDTYLVLSDRADLGIKVRNGDKIEIKQRLADRGICVLGTEAEGRIEQWAKWSFVLGPESANSPDTPLLERHWINVQKTRRSRKLAVISPHRVLEIEPNSKEHVLEGCNLELTTLRARNQIWQSVGFEAFGSIEVVEKNLMLVLSNVIQHDHFPRMKSQESFGYPEWLRKVVQIDTGSLAVV